MIIKSFLKNSNFCYLLLDSAGKILDANPQLLQITKYNSENFIGMKLINFVYIDEINSELENSILTGSFLKENKIIIPLLSSDQKKLYFKFLIFPKEQNIEYICLLEQILETDPEITASQSEWVETKEKNIFKSFSHEIRSPLNGILGMAELIQVETDLAKIAEYNKIQFKSVHKLLRITNVFEKFSTIDEKTIYNIEKINLVKFLEEDLLFFEHMMKEKFLELSFEADEFDGYVLCSEVMLSQIFSIVIDNAIKFTKVGNIDIKVEKLILEDLDFLSVKIIDTGIGISKDLLPTLFDSESQNTERGYSLGIVKEYLDLLNGNISVRSIQGMGTEVKLVFELF
jgi:signal transduction histidine kinase